MIPHRVRTSEQSAGRLKFLKSKTGLTPNILSRFAFVLSVRDMKRVTRGSIDLNGQEFNAPTLFGEHQELYDLLLVRYVESTNDQREPGAIIANLIEDGLHKIGPCSAIGGLGGSEVNTEGLGLQENTPRRPCLGLPNPAPDGPRQTCRQVQLLPHFARSQSSKRRAVFCHNPA